MDITGHKFNHLTAIEPYAPREPHRWLWRFRCDCGNETISNVYKVYNGWTHKCRQCADRDHSDFMTTHGLSRTREYRKLVRAKSRCQNPNDRAYSCYGGRGIRWGFESYEQALTELGPCPVGRSLDRIDNDGNYESKNVRWGTKAQQYASRRPSNWRQKQAFGK